MQPGLDFLAAEFGLEAPTIAQMRPDEPFVLAHLVDEEIESACREADQRDYASFGFGPWRP